MDLGDGAIPPGRAGIAHPTCGRSSTLFRVAENALEESLPPESGRALWLQSAYPSDLTVAEKQEQLRYPSGGAAQPQSKRATEGDYAEKMTVTADNPAARLRTLLAALRAQPARATSGEAWAEVLGINNEPTLLIHGLAKAIELSDRAQRIARDEGLNSTVMLRWVAPVTAALTHLADLDAPLRLVINLLDDSTMLSLQACEEAITSAAAEPPARAHLAEAVRLTDAILVEIANADLDSASRELIARHILALQQALKLYTVVGDTGLYDAMLSAMAALGVVDREAETQRQGWSTRIAGWLAVIADIVTVGQGLPQIL